MRDQVFMTKFEFKQFLSAHHQTGVLKKLDDSIRLRPKDYWMVTSSQSGAVQVTEVRFGNVMLDLRYNKYGFFFHDTENGVNVLLSELQGWVYRPKFKAGEVEKAIFGAVQAAEDMKRRVLA